MSSSLPSEKHSMAGPCCLVFALCIVVMSNVHSCKSGQNQKIYSQVFLLHAWAHVQGEWLLIFPMKYCNKYCTKKLINFKRGKATSQLVKSLPKQLHPPLAITLPKMEPRLASLGKEFHRRGGPVESTLLPLVPTSRLSLTNRTQRKASSAEHSTWVV